MSNSTAQSSKTSEYDTTYGSQSGHGFYRSIGKRAFDVAFVLAFAPVLLPVIGLLALLVRRDGGPALYSHIRIGRNGKAFACWKIRTMVPDAEARLRDHLAANPDLKEIWERDFKLADDPRITRLGSFLRKTSLDELPQFFNVLAGERSVVGPRPITRPELRFYGKNRPELLSVRPGVTGPWQVGGRNAVHYSRRVAIDLAYVRNLSFAGDLRLILATLAVVICRNGQ